MIRLNTLGALIDADMTVRGICHGCGHIHDLDLHDLADRLGRDHGCLAADLTPKLRCATCGSRRCGIQLSQTITPEM